MSFSAGWYLLLIPVLAAATIRVHRRSLSGLSPRQARASLIVRLGIQTLLILALAGPAVSVATDSLAVLFLLDRSRSIPAEAQERQVELVNRAARHLPGRARAGVVVFARDAMPETMLSATPALAQVRSVLERDGTNLSAALRMGLAMLPEGAQRRLVLISDGNETVEEAAREADWAGAGGVQVDVIPVALRHPAEVLLERLEAPATLLPGGMAEVRVVARATIPSRGILRLFLNGAPVAEAPWSLEPGLNATGITASIPQPGFHTWEARLEASPDGTGENNRAIGFTRVPGPPRVLIVEGVPGEGDALARALAGPALRLERRPPHDLPTTLPGWEPFAAVLLANVRADQVSPEAMRALARSVRDLGLGCVMVGGAQGLTAGGWRGTPVEEVMPVEMAPREEADDPPFALVLVIDRSGSMAEGTGGVSNLLHALQAAHLAVDTLKPQDEVGVIAFDTAAEWVVPLAKRGDAATIHERLGTIGPGGGTELHPALVAAGAALAGRRGAARHILVLTDGHSAPGDFDAVTAQIARAGITLSTIGVGAGADHQLLARLAGRAGGRHYRAERGESLPLMFEREVQLASGRVLIEEPFQPRPAPGASLLGSLTTAPPLRGYVATRPRDAPQVELPLLSHRGDPVLAAWRYGLGRAAVVTTDARGRWAGPWIQDREGGYFAAFWNRVVRSVLRATDPPGLEASIWIEGDQGQVTVEALTAEGEFRNGLRLEGRIAGPEGERTLRLAQVAPGLYRGEFPAPAVGSYLAAIREAGEEGEEGERGSAAGPSERVHGREGEGARGGGATLVVGAAVPYSPELRHHEENLALLTSIAERTGGRVWPALGDGSPAEMLPQLFRPGRPARTTPREVWPYLLLAAALLLPLDVALRRVSLDARELMAALSPALGGILARWRSRRPAAGDTGMGRLLGAKRRAAREVSDQPSALRRPPSVEDGKGRLRREGEVPPPDLPADSGAVARRLLEAKRRATGSGARRRDKDS